MLLAGPALRPKSMRPCGAVYIVLPPPPVMPGRAMLSRRTRENAMATHRERAQPLRGQLLRAEEPQTALQDSGPHATKVPPQHRPPNQRALRAKWLKRSRLCCAPPTAGAEAIGPTGACAPGCVEFGTTAAAYGDATINR
jgi:hypothetical protein